MNAPALAERASRSIVRNPVASALPAALGYALFETKLGWMAMAGSDNGVAALSFGHASPAAARFDLAARVETPLGKEDWNPALRRRLKAFAAGKADDFADVQLDLGPTTPFQQRVVNECRKVLPGQRCSYAELATRAGSPRAARAVGNVMRTNRVPLIVPCHRILGSGGRLGGYSMAQGLDTKQHLLDHEANMLAAKMSP